MLRIVSKFNFCKRRGVEIEKKRTLGDCHLYTNQIDVMSDMLEKAKSSTEVFAAPYLLTDLCNDADVLVPYPWEQFNFAVLGEGDKFKIWELGGYKSLGVFKMNAAA